MSGLELNEATISSFAFGEGQPDQHDHHRADMVSQRSHRRHDPHPYPALRSPHASRHGSASQDQTIGFKCDCYQRWESLGDDTTIQRTYSTGRCSFSFRQRDAFKTSRHLLRSISWYREGVSAISLSARRPLLARAERTSPNVCQQDRGRIRPIRTSTGRPDERACKTLDLCLRDRHDRQLYLYWSTGLFRQGHARGDGCSESARMAARMGSVRRIALDRIVSLSL